MFEYTDAFIYGYLIGLNIDIPLDKTSGGNTIWVPDTGGGAHAPPVNVEMGRGGGIRGENGKPMPGDSPSPGEQLCGGGGQIDAGGKGLHNGGFGFGGNGAVYLSAGGGGGWYGGGSSFIHAGGGGGSGFVWHYDFKYYVPSDYIVTDEYLASFYKLTIGNREGNGKCEITSPTGVKITFEYTGNVQEYSVDVTGNYNIKCYGAQGGSIVPSDEKLSGGLGGTAEGVFYLQAGIKLYVYVGQQGNTNINRPFGGGSLGVGGCTGGGGATDVRLLKTIDIDRKGLCSRLIVAGGGGGVGRLADGQQPLPPGGWEDSIGTNPNNPPGYEGDTSNDLIFRIGPLLINDLSTLHVDLWYKASFDTTDTLEYEVYVDNELWFTRSSAIKQGGGFHNEEFYFWEKLPEFTPAYLARIKVVVHPNDYILVPSGKYKVWVETPLRPIDNNNPDSDPLRRPIEIDRSSKMMIRDKVNIEIYEDGGEPEEKQIGINEQLMFKSSMTINIEETSGEKHISYSDNIRILDAFIIKVEDVSDYNDNSKEGLNIKDSITIIKEEPTNE